MATLSLIDAGKLRMVNMRIAHLELYVPDVRKLSSGGEVSIETDLEIEIFGDELEVTPGLTARISAVTEENQSEGSDEGDHEREAGRAVVKYVARYALPEGHGLTDSDLENLEPAQVDTFVHALQPMLVFRLKSLLQESGAVNPRIPPHIYAPTE